MKRGIVISLITLLCACAPHVKESSGVIQTPIDTLEIKYATGFAVNYFEGYKELLVFSANRKDTIQRYYLSNEEKEGFIKTPIKRLASLSSVYAAYIDELGLESSLVAVDDKNFINSASIRKVIDEGGIVDIGSLEKLNHEALLKSHADLVYTFGWQNNAVATNDKYPNISFAYAYEYLEELPLGRAEWIKFFACFFNLESKADSIFKEISTNYERLNKLTENVEFRPKILINMPFKEQWHMPGGLSYSAHFIEDAGGFYPWGNQKKRNSTPYDWELVYQEGFDSDFWINTGAYSSYAEVRRDLLDMELFEAFKNKKAFNNNAKMNSYGGNDYWESGLLHVDEVLADLIAIFHPEILPHHQLKYYKPLNDE